ncbi:hypothetical protein OQA88_10711 [Cercophora sp. LCS_1]
MGAARLATDSQTLEQFFENGTGLSLQVGETGSHLWNNLAPYIAFKREDPDELKVICDPGYHKKHPVTQPRRYGKARFVNLPADEKGSDFVKGDNLEASTFT